MVAEPVPQIEIAPVRPIVLTTIVSNSSTVSLEPLKTSRFSSDSSNAGARSSKMDGRLDPAVKANKLLNSALQSTRKNTTESRRPSSSDSQQSSNNAHQKNENSSLLTKRGRGESDTQQAESGSTKRQVIYQQQLIQQQQQQQQQQQHHLQLQQPQAVYFNYNNPLHPPPPQQPRVAAEMSAATPLVETVKYFEEMNKIAKESGFQNAQEMLASQKEMMSLMAAAAVPAPTPFFPPPPPGYGYGADMTGYVIRDTFSLVMPSQY